MRAISSRWRPSRLLISSFLPEAEEKFGGRSEGPYKDRYSSLLLESPRPPNPNPSRLFS